MTKTNKSLAKRLKFTKRGKVLTRQAGISHLSAKKRRAKQIGARRLVPAAGFKRKELIRLMPTN